MARSAFYTFRVPSEDQDIIQLLNQAPNRSDLIRKALRCWLDGNSAIYQQAYQTAYQDAFKQVYQELLQKVDHIFQDLSKQNKPLINSLPSSKSTEEEEDLELVINSEIKPLERPSAQVQQATDDKLKAKILAGIRKLQVAGNLKT